jgi:hypothetical protein
MPDLTRDFPSLARFRRQSPSFAKLLKRTQRPLVLRLRESLRLSYRLLSPISACSILQPGKMRGRAFRQGLEDAKKRQLERSSPPSKLDVASQVKLTHRAERDLDLL